ncbi:MAG: ATP-dependent helicase [Gammaproteobacteria bacterium]|nr:ATP-dependent helicase [Gammaproteobacteria bacterium]
MIEYRAIGPPGCGKTTWLQKQVKLAVQKHGSGSVLLASLTRAAAAELAGRDMPVDEQSIGTLHAHAYRSLDRPELAQDKKHIDAWNEYVCKKGYEHWRLTKSLKQDDMGKASHEEQTEGDELYEMAETFRHRCIPFDDWMVDRVQSWFEAWQDFKEMSFAMDFTDMIVKASEVVERAPGNPRFVFLDEAQDLSLLELKLARKWAEHCEVFIMVGDPDQCLYEWRGSSPLNFENPKLDEANYKYLSQSWRVPAAVHRVAVNWIEQVPGRRKVEYLPRKKNGDGPTVQGVCRNEDDLSFQTPEELFEDAEKYLSQTVELDDGTIRPKTVMFLGSAGYMLHPIIRFLREEGIPFHNPYNTKRGDWNPLGAVGRKGSTSMAERIRAFAYCEWLNNWDELVKWLPLLKLEHFRESRFVTSKHIESLHGRHDADELKTVLSEEAIKRAIATDFAWLVDGMKAQYKNLRSTHYAIRLVEKNGEAILNKKPQIMLGTIHSVKGGQADVVYVFPDLSPAADDEWQDDRSKPGICRVFYVAMTRAREELVLCDPSSDRAVEFPEV